MQRYNRALSSVRAFLQGNFSEIRMIRDVQLDDAAKLAIIYNYYVTHTVVTFEEQEVSEDVFRSKIQASIEQGNEQGHLWLVLEDRGEIVGYAYCAPWMSRSAYRYTHEVTVYLDHQHTGKGFGSTLMNALLNHINSVESERKIYNLVAIIALPNEASVALHEALGMKKVAHFPKVGYKFSNWVDVGYWQLSFL